MKKAIACLVLMAALVVALEPHVRDWIAENANKLTNTRSARRTQTIFFVFIKIAPYK